jgi:hypothetical protein
MAPKHFARLATLLLVLASPVTASDYFTITVRDDATGNPIPGIRLSTINNIIYRSDASGRIDFYEPGLMGTQVLLYFDACLGGPLGPYCALEPTTGCSSSVTCTQGYEPMGLQSFIITPTEGGSAEMFLCASPAGSCVSELVSGPPLSNPVPTGAQRLKIRVVDAQSGRGVPLVNVQSPARTFVTDSAGVVAYHETGLMGTNVQFTFKSFGYADTSATLLTTPGTTATVPITRANVAERMYRVTGGGIYRDTVLMGESAPIANPTINARVFGQDSVQTALYKGKIFWIWGDTKVPNSLYQNFLATAAQSDLPGSGGLDPSLGVNLAYYGDGAGFVVPMCSPADFPNPPHSLCWLSSASVVKDGAGNDRLYAVYVRDIAESGLAVFDDVQKKFKVSVPAVILNPFNPPRPIVPSGHTEKIRHASFDYLYYADRGLRPVHPADNPVRIRALESKITDPSSWESFTALKQGPNSNELLFLADGTLDYSWRPNTPPIDDQTGPIYPVPPNSQIPANQKLFGHLKDIDSGAGFTPLSVSMAWNPYRERYTETIQVTGSTGFLGTPLFQNWYSEADTPMGPWVYGRMVASHPNYNFYSTRQHPYFKQANGRFIYFESTYTNLYTFGPAAATPRYDYNQLMYRLDVDDPRVVLPMPVYDQAGPASPGDFITKTGVRPGTAVKAAVFMAPDRAGMPGTVPYWWNDADCEPRALAAGGTPLTTPVFWALPPNVAPANTILLYEFTKNSNPSVKAYGTGSPPNGYGAGVAIARVWTNPINVRFPVNDYISSLIANAGGDRCPTASAGSGTATIGLHGGNSTNSAGSITSYQWNWTGLSSGSATGVSPNITLAPGLYNVVLTVTGSGGDTNTDDMVIRVNAP